MQSFAQQANIPQAYHRAVELLQRSLTPDGFLASPTEHDNYRRIWARDGVIIGLAALLTEDHELTQGLRETLITLAKYQGPHGEIPSNVDPVSLRVSYGGTTGRVDASLWFIIGCGEYWKATGDTNFITDMLPALEKTRNLLGAWEFNNRGLIYVPQTGDWADEYLHSGYVLYDQLLYLQAQRTFCHIHEVIHGGCDHHLHERVAHLKHLIQANYWLRNGDGIPDDVYHEVLYEKGLKAGPLCSGDYWMPFFSPTGYGYRFDGFANILAMLLDISTPEQCKRIDHYIESIVPDELPLLPAYHPVIQPVDEDWKDLQMTFSFTFKNKPYEFQNGGLWPLITGFYIADLTRRNLHHIAKHYLEAIDHANSLAINDEPWSFAEFVHGKTLAPGGTQYQGWSAAASIIGHRSMAGETLFRINHRK